MKKIGRRLAPDPRSQPGLARIADKDQPPLYNISVEHKKGESHELMNSSSQHLNHQQSQQPTNIPQAAHGTVEYHNIKVEHLPNY